jgi:hypothetical protein
MLVPALVVEHSLYHVVELVAVMLVPVLLCHVVGLVVLMLSLVIVDRMMHYILSFSVHVFEFHSCDFDSPVVLICLFLFLVSLFPNHVSFWFHVIQVYV